jgi:hypothetical protein
VENCSGRRRTTLFTGLDDIDWHAMQHAYGPADEVPDLLRGLISDDPAVRESALDGMYGAVHHQGDVYECTIASIPFLLEAAAHRGLPGRGAIVELLASIAGEDGEDEVLDDADESAEDTYRRANVAVAAAYPVFVDLLDDPDPLVRRAAPLALRAGRAQAAVVATALRERLPAETDAEARAALVKALGALAGRAAAGRLPGLDAAAVGAWLAAIVSGPDDPSLRLVVLAELARCASAALPPDVVPTAVELLAGAYAQDRPPPQAAGFSTDTLVGALRELREREAAGRRAPHAAELVRDLSLALGDRVDDRIGLLTALLREAEWERRYDALRPATVLIEGWRGPYRELVQLIGEQLLDPQPRLCALAAESLRYLDRLAAPAADALARSLEHAPRLASHERRGGSPSWITIWPRDLPTTGPTLRALAALRDARALPALRWALEHENPPGDIGFVAGSLGAAAAELVPLIRRRLRDLPSPEGSDRRRDGLVAGLGNLGDAAAPALPELLALLPDTGVLRTLGRIGPAAARAVTVLRPLLEHADRSVAVQAASALWRIEGDPAPVLPVLARSLDSDGWESTAAIAGIAALGPAGASQAARLRTLLGGPDQHGWTRLRVAEALWRTTGDTGTALPLLTAVWTENPATRTDVVRCLKEMGAAAVTAVPLLREELGRARRHSARDHGWSSDQVRADEALLRLCAEALTAMAGG